MPNASVAVPRPRRWSGLLLVTGGAVLLSAKGILSKLLYAEGLDFQEVVTLRALLSLPLFWLWGSYRVGLAKITGAERKPVLGAIAAGILCYYVGGSLDFYALTLIDAGLERVLLYTYPAIIVFSLALWHRRRPPMPVLCALFMTCAGILLVVGVFDRALWQANAFGAVLVLICALTYAAYFFANELVGRQVGRIVFTVYALSAATFSLLLHYSLSHSLLAFSISARAWGLMGVLVVFVTVIPLFMLAEGVRQSGAQRAGLVSTVGPASTVLLAALFLDESMRWFQYLGVLVTLLGIVILEWQQKLPAVSD